MKKRIAILVRNDIKKIRDVGDINGKALSQELRNLGYDVDLVSLYNDVKTTHSYSYLQGLTRSYDVIYASSPKRFFTLACLFFSIVHFSALHISIFDSNLTPIVRNPGKLFFKLLHRIKVLRLYAVSKYQQRYINKNLGLKTKVLLPCLLYYGTKTRRRPKLDTIVFAGSTNNEKRGLDVLIKSVALLAKKNEKIRLRILNKFTHQERWSQVSDQLISELQIKKYVTKVGYIKDMSAEYNKAAVYCLPFKRTTYIPPLPFTMIEALSYGVPVVSSNKPQLVELIQNDLLVSPLTPSKLAQALEKALKTKKVSLDPQYQPTNVARRFAEIVIKS